MKTNKLFQVVTFILLVCSILGLSIYPAQAQSEEDNISFALLSQDEISLQGPSDIASFTFNLPATWEVKDGARLYLSFNTTFNASSTAMTGTSENSVAGYLQVTLNETRIGTILLDQQGEITVELPLLLSAWNDLDPALPHRLEFTLRTPGPCNDSYADYASSFNGGLGVLIHPTSYLYLPHTLKPMVTDLRRLPYPIYQDSFLPDKAILLIPDQPTNMELSAVLTTAAVFGRMTEGNLALETLVSSEITQPQLESSHLIFVGKASAFPQLKQANLPAPIKGQGFNIPELGKEDGILQAVVSPLNPTHIWVVVSGLSDEGVVKASQALGGGEEIRVSENTNLSIITDSQYLQSKGFYGENMSFEDLGYDERVRWGPGLRYVDYTFDIPAGQAVHQGAFLDLVFAHSAMLDMDGSGITVSLNSDYIGSYRFSHESTKVTNWHLELPSSSFRQGENALTLRVTLEATSSCLSYQQLWFAVRPESALHMNLIEAPYEEARAQLNKYPYPFVPNLINTAFVVPKNDVVSWVLASQVAYDLGKEAGGVYIDMAVAFADAVPDKIRNERDILVIGLPSQTPFIQELTPQMPAPFDEGSNIATEAISGFTFNVSPEIPVGYLEVFLSPWDAQHVVMTLSGNGADGLTWASEALLDPEKFAELRGNLAILYDDQIIPYAVNTKQTSTLISVETSEEVTSAATAVAIDTQNTSANTGLPLASITIGAIAIVALALLGFFLNKGRQKG